MLKDGRVVGGIAIYRPEVRPFTQKQIDLVSTFANQAVIAVENVRLFRELQSRNKDLTTALDQQTATADILRAISRSQNPSTASISGQATDPSCSRAGQYEQA